MKGPKWRGVWFCVLAATLGGCDAADDEPTYAELVVLYNAELETLERLKKQRADLLESYSEANGGEVEEAVQALAGALKTATEAPAGERESADAFAALDEAVARAERTGQVASEIIDSVRDSSSPELKLTPEQQTELMKLDVEIAEQQARVDRAKAARDAAEAK